MDERQEEPEPAWHFRPLMLWHLLAAFLPLAFVLAGYVWSVEKRLTIMEENVIVLHRDDDYQRDRFREAMGIVRDDIRALGAKVDRLIERLAIK